MRVSLRAPVLLVVLASCGTGMSSDRTSGNRARADAASPPLSTPGDRELARIPESGEYSELLFSPDLGSVAYILSSGQGQRVVLNGTAGPVFDRVEGLFFNATGERLAYKATRDGKQLLVNAGEAGESFERIRGISTFASDGKTLVFSARNATGWVVRAGNRTLGSYEEAGEPICSSVSGRIAFAAKLDGKWYVVSGESREGGVDLIPSDFLVFSKDGAELAWVGWEGPDRFVWHRGRKGEPFAGVGKPALSPDGSRVAYRAQEREDSRWRLVLGSVKSRLFDWVGDPRFSADGRHVVCEASDGRQRYVLVDEQEQKIEGFEIVSSPALSVDGQVLAYRAAGGPEDSQQWWMVVQGRKGPTFSFVGPPRFSDHGNWVCYEARTSSAWLVVGGEQMSNRYDQTWSPTFSPDGRSVRFGARKGRVLYSVSLPLQP